MAKRSTSRPQQQREEGSQSEKSGRAESGKNPRNVAGGKKAQATRKEHGKSHH